MDFSHVSVLLSEVLSWLSPRDGDVVLDGTLGGGGHAKALLMRAMPNGLLVGLDRDEQALSAAKQHLGDLACRAKLVHANFFDAAKVLENLGVTHVDRAILDLGVSSPQLDQVERGFSYRLEAPLDMRMDATAALTAYDVVNTWSQQDLMRILREYGEERFASKMARMIVEERQKHPIATTLELADVAIKAIPKAAREKDQHPARRLFQAVRIAVNDELSGLGKAVEDIVGLLSPGGKMGVITFHSLEDRIVKHTFAKLYAPCTCPKSLPVCVCGKQSLIEKVPKSVVAGDEELLVNPRSRSARLRMAQKRAT